MKMMDKAILLNPPTFQGIYTDAGRIFTLCAVEDLTLKDATKAELITRSEELYKKAQDLEPNKQYLYSSWASAYYWRGQYIEAWDMIAKERDAGGKPSERFLNLLREKIPESNRKLLP